MKRIIALMLAAFVMLPLSSCAKKPNKASSSATVNQTRRTLKIGAAYDESAILIADMMQKNEQKKLQGEYLISLFEDTDAVAKKLMDRSIDAALLPAGVAISTAKAGSGLRIAAALSSDNLFAVTKTTEITDIKGLKSKKIGVLNTFNEKSVLSDLMSANGIALNDITLDTFKTADDLKKAAESQEYDVLVAAEPYAALCQSYNEKYAFRLSLGEFWKSAHSKSLPGTLLVISSDCAVAYRQEFSDLTADLKASVKAVSADTDRVAKLVKNYGVSQSIEASKQSVEAISGAYTEKNELSSLLKNYLEAIGSSFGAKSSELSGILLN